MLWIGLTGGIGSGKSTVAGWLADSGARVLDADRLARAVVEPGTPGLEQVVARFGTDVLAPDGALDRAALGRVVFADPAARQDLEGITHPLIARETADWLAGLPDGAVAVHDVPLLVELGYAPRYHLVVVVGADEQVRRERLVHGRGMDEREATSRIRAQADDAARRAVADAWLDNAGDQSALREQVDRLWRRIQAYGANLAARRPATTADLAVPAPPAWELRARGTRVAARVRHVLGDRAGEVSPLPTPEQLAPAWRPTVQIRPQGPADARLRADLCAAGFPSLTPERHGSADPGRLADLQLVPDPTLSA